MIELTEPVKSAASQKLLADAHLARGLSVIHAGKPAEAVKDLDEAATHNPHDPGVLAKYSAQGVQVVNVSLTSGDTRFFYKEDERLATQVRDLAETVIADAGYNLRLAVRYVAAGKGVEPGTIEIWIPSLSDANLFGAKNRAYQSKY